MSNFTDSRHEFFEVFHPRWQFYLDSYEGGQDYLDAGYLFRHFRENELDYQDRCMRSYYYNFCRTVIDAYVSQIFHQTGGIFRDSRGVRDFDRFLENVDGKSTSMQVFMMEQVAPAAQIFGHVHVLIDKPVTDRQPASRAEEEALDMRPYLALIYPENLVDFLLDDKGGFVWARIMESAPPSEDPFEFDAEDPAPVFRTWTTDGWYLHDENGELIASGAHNLGRVPIVTVHNVESKRYPGFGVSALSDVAPVNRSIFNWCSLNDEFLYRQCFNILAVPETPGVKTKKLGTKSAITFPCDTSKTPFYIYPPVEPGEYLLKNINDAVRQIYRIAVLMEYAPAETRQIQSGVSKAYDFQRSNQNMLKKARNLEQAEIEIGEVWGLWQGLEAFRPVIEYPSNFDVRSLAEQLETDFELIRADISDTFTRAVKKRVTSRAMKLGAADQKRIHDEIDSAAESPKANPVT